MLYSFIIVCILNSPIECPVKFEDELGPYNTTAECYLRGAEMIALISHKFPISAATASCVLKQKQDKVEEKAT